MLLVPIALLVLALPAAALWLALRHPRNQRDGGRCGKCGYNVRGIESWTCPECGADLREVGILGKRQAGGKFFFATMAWLCFITLAGLLVTFVATRITHSAHTTYYHQRTIFVQAPSWNATITAHHRSPSNIQLEISGVPNAPRLHLDSQTNHCIVGHNGPVQAFNASTLLDWAGRNVPKPHDADTLTAANDTIDAVREMIQTPSTGFTYRKHVTAHPVSIGGSQSSYQRSGTPVMPLLGVIVAVSFGMAGLLWMKSRMQPPAWQVIAVVACWIGGVTLIAAVFFVA